MDNKKEKQILISVIVPVYNVEKYIERCVNSILNQSVDAFEVILIDDGSEDKRGDYVMSFKLEIIGLGLYIRKMMIRDMLVKVTNLK